ncbi:MAG: hypothetical protein ABJL54_00185 [Halioglobus sp.]
MSDDTLLERLDIAESRREAFLFKLHAIERNWPTIRDGELPDRGQLKKTLEQYFKSVEKTLRLARQLPDELLSLPPDPNGKHAEAVKVFEGRALVPPSSTAATAWTQNPPHPVDYLEYLLVGRIDLVSSLRAVEDHSGASIEYRGVDDLLPNVPRKDVYPRNWLLNQLMDLFAVGYPDDEATLYWDDIKNGYAGRFYRFLSEALQSIDTEEGLQQKLARRYKDRQKQGALY